MLVYFPIFYFLFLISYLILAPRGIEAFSRKPPVCSFKPVSGCWRCTSCAPHLPNGRRNPRGSIPNIFKCWFIFLFSYFLFLI